MLRFILLTLSLLCITNASASTDPSNSVQESCFPFLPSYTELKNGVYKWLPPINKMIMYHVKTFVTLKSTSKKEEETLDTLGEDAFMYSLWQVFLPGSWIDHVSLIGKSTGPKQVINVIKVLVKPWEPLQHDQVVLIYSTLVLGKIEVREWRYKRPASTVNSTLIMHPIEGQLRDIRDACVLVLHIQRDMLMNLNQTLIEILTHDFRIQSDKEMPNIILKKGASNPLLLPVLKGLEKVAFPANIPLTNVTKLIQAGFIPLLPSYHYDKSLMGADMYMLLIKRIIATIIQKHIPIIHRDDPLAEVIILAHCLKHHLRPFFPGWDIQAGATSQQYDVFSLSKDDPNINSIFLYSAPYASSFLSVQLTFEETHQSRMSIAQFLELRPLVYPNLALLRGRRFSGISSTIYNNATASQTNLIDFKPFIHQYLTTFSMLYTAGLPTNTIINMLPEYKSLVIETTVFVLEEGATLTVIPGVPYDAHTTIAYDDNLLYSIHFPFLLFELTGRNKVTLKTAQDRTFKVITAVHMDEPELNIPLVTTKTLSEY